MPLFWLTLPNDLKIINDLLLQMLPLFEMHGFNVVGAVSGGDFNRQSLILKAHAKMNGVQAFGDFEHLLKTIRNKMCRDSNKKGK